MPTFNIADPATGKQFQVTSDQPLTDAEIDDVLASGAPPTGPSLETQQAQAGSELFAPAGPVRGAGQLAGEVGGAIAQAATDPATLASTAAPFLVPGGPIVKGVAAGVGGMAGRAAQTLTQEGRFPTAVELGIEGIGGFLPESIARPLFGADEAGRVLRNMDAALGKGVLGRGAGKAAQQAGIAIKDALPGIRKAITAEVDAKYEAVRRVADTFGLVSSNPSGVSAAVDATANELAQLATLEPARAKAAQQLIAIIQQDIATGVPLSFRRLSEFRTQLGELLPEFHRKQNLTQTAIGRLSQTLKNDMLAQVDGTPLEKQFKQADRFFQHEAIPQRNAARAIASDNVTPDAVAQFILQKPSRVGLMLKRAAPDTVQKVRVAILDDIFEKATTPAGIFQPAEAFAAIRKMPTPIRQQLFQDNVAIGRVIHDLEKVVAKRAEARPLMRQLGQAAALGVPAYIVGNQILAGASVDAQSLALGLATSVGGIRVLAGVLGNPTARNLMQKGLAQKAGSQAGLRLMTQALSRAGFETVFGTPAAGALPAEQVEPSLL